MARARKAVPITLVAVDESPSDAHPLPLAAAESADESQPDPVIEPSLVVLAARWFRRRSPRQLLAMGLSAALAVGAGIGIEHLAEQDRLGRVAAAPGGLRSLEHPLAEQWTLDLSAVELNDHWWVLAGETTFLGEVPGGIAVLRSSWGAPDGNAQDETQFRVIGIQAQSGNLEFIHEINGLEFCISPTTEPAAVAGLVDLLCGNVAPIHAAGLGAEERLVTMADGGFALVARHQDTIARWPVTTQVMDTRGVGDVVLYGRLLNPEATDGTGGLALRGSTLRGGGSLFTIDGTDLVAWDDAAAEVWRRDVGTSSMDALARTDDKLVLASPRTAMGARGLLLGVDVEFGRVRWSAPIAGSAGVPGPRNVAGAWTDGETVLVRSPEHGQTAPQATYWTARSLSTGEQIWQVKAVREGVELPEVDDNIVVVSPEMLAGECQAVNGYLLCLYGGRLARVS